MNKNPSNISDPIVEKLAYNSDSLERFVEHLKDDKASGHNEYTDYVLEYPTVYVIKDDSKNGYSVYVGETTDIKRRTLQHLKHDPSKRVDWRSFAESDNAEMYVIGHEYFNKSLTLDIENRLMLYMSGNNNVSELRNRRENEQRRYYTQEYFDDIFAKLWDKLRDQDRDLFPDRKIIQDSALFKASPFHKLSEQQIEARDRIFQSVMQVLTTGDETDSGMLILVTGDAGAGKTVLLSSLFHKLFQNKNYTSGNEDTPELSSLKDLDAYLLVNHDEQLTVYEGIGRKLGLFTNGEERIMKPTRFINNHSTNLENIADVILVDEAHLLWTQGKQSYRGKNQLLDLLDRSRVVIAVFDPKQALAANQYWEDSSFSKIEDRIRQNIHLTNQMRMEANQKTVDWVRGLIDDGIVRDLSLGMDYKDDHDYEVRIFSDPSSMYKMIRGRSLETEQGLSRMLATYDWRYRAGDDGNEMWTVDIGSNFSMPWNRELKNKKKLTREQERNSRNLSWPEQPHTIDEVGSIFTIQGFDLNYAAVILGPSVKFRNGEIVIDETESFNKAATMRRTLQDGSKKRSVKSYCEMN